MRSPFNNKSPSILLGRPVWKVSELDVDAAWTGSPMPDSFWTYGTPLAAELPATSQKAAVD
jgi:hypothetical protein